MILDLTSEWLSLQLVVLASSALVGPRVRHCGLATSVDREIN